MRVYSFVSSWKYDSVSLCANEMVNGVALHNVECIVLSFKRRTELEEKKNAISDFLRNDYNIEKDIQDCAEFLRVIYKRNMHYTCEKDRYRLHSLIARMKAFTMTDARQDSSISTREGYVQCRSSVTSDIADEVEKSDDANVYKHAR